MKRMEKMERRLTWVLENGVEHDGSGGQSDGGMGASSESDLTPAPSSASNSLAADAPMPEASKMLARRELERLIAERDEAVAALAKERTGSGRSPSELALRSENRRLATENAELRAHLGHSRGRNGANTQGGGTSDLTAQKGEAARVEEARGRAPGVHGSFRPPRTSFTRHRIKNERGDGDAGLVAGRIDPERVVAGETWDEGYERGARVAVEGGERRGVRSLGGEAGT